MANALYDKARESFLKGEISWSTDAIKALLADSAVYTLDLAADQYLSDVPAEARKGNLGGQTDADMPTLGTKTTTAGVADAADITFESVSAGGTYEYLVLYKSTGVEGTSRLIGCIDQAASGLPATPTGADIPVAWDDGANRIFKL